NIILFLFYIVKPIQFLAFYIIQILTFQFFIISFNSFFERYEWSLVLMYFLISCLFVHFLTLDKNNVDNGCNKYITAKVKVW
ncbi:hypothetical protein VIGAN_08265200, partial [Vigna angularis var. angularis]